MVQPELSLFLPPYTQFSPIQDATDLDRSARNQAGAALLWNLRPQTEPGLLELIQQRPGGVALIVILPESDRLAKEQHILQAVELCRPHSIMPFHQRPTTTDLKSLLSRTPDDLAVEVIDYIAWRGLVLDTDTRRFVRRTIELSADIRSVSALSRSLYISRRALGRRLLMRGLPVPSHWLHLGRLLRACLRLQATDATLFTVACDLGYPDGFALSNQMERLIGVRPTTARSCLGWEWILEFWMRQEAEHGGLLPKAEPIARSVRTTRKPDRRPRSIGTRRSRTQN